MLNSISWYTFLLAIGSVCAVYYLVIGMICYKRELLELWDAKGKNFLEPVTDTLMVAGKDQPVIPAKRQEDEKINFPTMVQELVAELSSYFTEASKRKLIREEFMTGLQLKINAYWQIRDSPYRNAVNHLIQMESQTQCSVYLTEGELELLWNKQVGRAF
jgi:hypothetical protein